MIVLRGGDEPVEAGALRELADGARFAAAAADRRDHGQVVLDQCHIDGRRESRQSRAIELDARCEETPPSSRTAPRPR